MTDGSDRTRVKSVETALDVIEYIHRERSATIGEVADALGIGKSTAHRHLTTLHDRRYVTREDDRYRLSLRFLTFGGRTVYELPAREMIERKVEQLCDETGERAQFVIEEHGERVYAYTHAGPNAVRTDAAVGKRGPLHVSAAGKAILAHLPVERREALITEVSDDASLGARRVREELAAVRERGYAFNDEESTTGLRAVGVPVACPDGRVLGAISVSGPANRLTGAYFREEIPVLLLGAVNEIELNLKYR
ncbi:IclR family transcriptional regulator [Halorubrum vacuolatum]|uniref:Transcriptional regulator, IclR family n=1 Tax=Halorubrum vacuolatum TaxID=63740 RepID=A0A238WIJ8_HALVU|nr:IclR family transcriptional regulator [Halorubrum vacuolatum]SNR46380.1 transcriptional regulator, IclR family [Halorubrum vacuolatum]